MKVSHLPHVPRNSKLRFKDGRNAKFVEYFPGNDTVMYTIDASLFHTGSKSFMKKKPRVTKQVAALLKSKEK